MTFIKRIAGAAAISAAMLVGLSVAQAGYVVDLTQQGGNVVASGSGEIDLAGLTGGYCCGEESFIRPNFGIIFTGSNAPVDIYYGLTGPSSFGSGPSSIFASSGSGDIVGAASGSELYVPDGYVTDSALSDTATYLGQTFSSLGVTPGRYEWAWGSGLNQIHGYGVAVSIPRNSPPHCRRATRSWWFVAMPPRRTQLTPLIESKWPAEDHLPCPHSLPRDRRQHGRADRSDFRRRKIPHEPRDLPLPMLAPLLNDRGLPYPAGLRSRGHAAVTSRPTSKDPYDLVADKVHHSPESLTEFDDAPRTARIAEPKIAKA
jgi:hypothetical protein